MPAAHARSDAEWMLETIVEDFAQSLGLADRAHFYARLVELLTERRDRMQRALNSGERKRDSLERVH